MQFVDSFHAWPAAFHSRNDRQHESDDAYLVRLHGQYLSTVARLAPGAGGHYMCRIIACYIQYASIAITLPVGSLSIMILSTLRWRPPAFYLDG